MGPMTTVQKRVIGFVVNVAPGTKVAFAATLATDLTQTPPTPPQSLGNFQSFGDAQRVIEATRGRLLQWDETTLPDGPQQWTATETTYVNVVP